MIKLLLAAAMSVSLLGCTNTDPALGGAAAGGAAGALLGAAVSGNDTRGAIIGGTIGAVAGATLASQNSRTVTPGAQQCRYQDAQGRIFTADCP